MERVAFWLKSNQIQIERLIPIIWVVSITLIGSMVLNVMALASVGLNTFFPEKIISLLFPISILFSFIWVPQVLYRKLLSFQVDEKLRIRTIVLFVATFLAMVPFGEIEMIFHFFAIALGEEYLFRRLHFKYIEKELGRKRAMIVTALVFALLLHLNEPLLSNILVRFPIGMGFTYIATRFGLDKAVVGHWVYNFIVTII